jgi:hypothetical protein
MEPVTLIFVHSREGLIDPHSATVLVMQPGFHISPLTETNSSWEFLFVDPITNEVRRIGVLYDASLLIPQPQWVRDQRVQNPRVFLIPPHAVPSLDPLQPWIM